MEINHRTHNLHIAPRKLRLVAETVKHQSAGQALALLNLIPNLGAFHVAKSLKSAVAMAKEQSYDPDTLKIQRISVDEGSKLKRSVHHSRGRMSMIKKHSSHLSIVLVGEAKKRSSRRIAKPATEPSAEATLESIPETVKE